MTGFFIIFLTMEDDEQFSEDMSFFKFKDALKNIGFFEDDTYRYTTLCVLNNHIFQIFVYNYGECTIHKRKVQPGTAWRTKETQRFALNRDLQDNDYYNTYIRPGALLNIIEESTCWEDFCRRAETVKLKNMLEKM